MTRYLFLFFLIFGTLVAGEKKIVIFTCRSGGGHLATADAISAILKKDYVICKCSPQDELFPMLSSSYSYYLSHNNYTMLNGMYYLKEVMQPLFYLVSEPTIFTHLESVVIKEKPDLLISVVPSGNQVLLDISKKYNIPFLIVTSDNDIRHWVYGLKYKNRENMQITISRDLPFTKMVLLENGFKLEQIQVTGMAVRPDFYETKDIDKLCREFNIPKEKRKVLIMFGGPGSPKILDYIDKISSTEKDIHIIAACGNNQELVKTLKEKTLPNGNSLTALSFTTRISDYMAISDLLITKSGPGTIEEAMILELPILIDGTQGFCLWEKANSELVKMYDVGAVIENLDQLPSLLNHYLRNETAIKKAYKKVPKNTFPQNIKNIVKNLLHD